MKISDFPQLKDTVKNEITTADGMRMILFTIKPLTNEEKSALEEYTREEIGKLFCSFGFKKHKIQ